MDFANVQGANNKKRLRDSQDWAEENLAALSGRTAAASFESQGA